MTAEELKPCISSYDFLFFKIVFIILSPLTSLPVSYQKAILLLYIDGNLKQLVLVDHPNSGTDYCLSRKSCFEISNEVMLRNLC